MKHLPNIIIIEGIDRVGKTTIVNKISNKFGYEIFIPLNKNLDKRTELIETEKLYATLSLLKLLKKDKVIIDRFHISEFVYGLYDRKYTNYECYKIDRILSELNSLLIYVRPTSLKMSVQQHGSDLTNHNSLFELMYNKSLINKISCKYNDFDAIIESLESGCYK